MGQIVSVATGEHRRARVFRRGVDHRKCSCGECGASSVYECGGCLKLAPWCFGAADEFEDLCDDCWAVRVCTRPQVECKHAWESAINSRIASGEWCPKCGSIRGVV